MTADDTPCAVCGGAVPLDGAAWFGPWRVHPDCRSRLGDPVRRVQAAAEHLGLGSRLTGTDAALVAGVCPVAAYHSTQPEPVPEGRAPRRWGHVARKRLVAAVSTLPALRLDAGLVPTTCTDGPCGYCGVIEHRAWFADGHRWLDGTPAPLCGDCHAEWVKAGSPNPAFPDEQADAIMRAVLLGHSVMMGDRPPPGLQTYVEAAPADRPGNAGPWRHLPALALERYRLTLWGRWDGAYAPPEHRERAAAFVTERDSRRAESNARADAETRAQADVYGFGRL